MPTMRRSLALGAALVLIAAACTVAAEDPEDAEGAATPEAQPAVTAAEYRELRSRLTRMTLEATGALNQLALVVVRDPDVRANPQFAQDLRAVIGVIELQVSLLRDAEPVPPGYEAAHEALLEAFASYTMAASALLPGGEGGPAEFDFAQFQEPMQAGGARFHSADDLLP